MWVDPGSRRLGIGARLIGELERWALGWQASETVLWVLANNPDGLAFYRRLGFEVLDAGQDAEAGARYGAVAMRRDTDPTG
jgi:GNAT superfamily N-acetyltransferase